MKIGGAFVLFFAVGGVSDSANSGADEDNGGPLSADRLRKIFSAKKSSKLTTKFLSHAATYWQKCTLLI